MPGAVRVCPVSHLTKPPAPRTTGHRPQCVDGVDVRRLHRVLRAHAPRLGAVHMVQRTLAPCTTACDRLLACEVLTAVSTAMLQQLSWLQVGMKVITAGISYATAIAVYKLIPLALAIPSPIQLEKEINERKDAQRKLQTQVYIHPHTHTQRAHICCVRRLTAARPRTYISTSDRWCSPE